jgi:transposase
MAGETIDMIKLKQIFLLKARDESISNISRIVDSSRNTVKKYIRLAEEKNLDFNKLAQKPEFELEKIFAEPVKHSKDRVDQLHALFPKFTSEINRVGVTRWTLWGEYKVKHPDGFSYAHFCDYFSKWLQSKKATMYLEHEPGAHAFFDHTGKKLQFVDKETGEIIPVEVFVGILGNSQLTYVEASLTQKKHDFINSVENALHYFQGVPRSLVPDNLKSAVTKADKYEPEINRTFLDFANHYNTAVIPARSRKPQDKALVENAVKIVYSRIFAPLRNQTFFSLDQLNEAISDLLEEHNNMNFSRENISRRKRFEQDEKDFLSPLPSKKFEIKSFKQAKVMKIGHVQIEKHYYSVPYRFIGKNVKIVYTQTEVNIFYQGQCIAFHRRGYKKFAYTTNSDHLSSTHKFVSEWTPQKFIDWAAAIDPIVKSYIEKVIEKKTYPEHAYRSCVGILSYEKKIGKQRLIKAIERATFYQVYNYKVIKKILQGNLDMLMDEELNLPQRTLPFHENIRGANNYK